MRQGLVVETGRRNLAGRGSDIRAYVPELPGNLHRGHQAGVEEDIIQFVGNGRRKVVQLDFFLFRAGGIVFLAERVQPGRSPVDAASPPVLALIFLGIAVIIVRKPSRRMGGKDGPVTGCRECFPDQVQDFRDHRGIRDRSTGRPYLQRVRTGFATHLVQADEGRLRLLGIIPVRPGHMAEYQQDIVVPAVPGQIAFLEGRDVRGDVAAQRIESGFIEQHHLACFLSIRAHGQSKVQPVPLAGENRQQQEEKGYEASVFHKNTTTDGQS